MSSAASHPPADPSAYLSIGELLGLLRPEFPDVTISKIRFLEAEGLVTPQRAPSGYRKFSREDVTRLQYVLSAQRDRYLPLRVIKEHLEAIDRGLEPPSTPGGSPTPPQEVAAAAGLPGPAEFGPERSTVRLTRSELLADAGIDDAQLAQLEQFGMIDPGGSYDGIALVVARAVGQLARFGIEPRHLRAFRTAADREVGLFEQVLTPLARQRGDDARSRTEQAAQELAALSVQLHTALVRHRLRAALSS